MTCIPSFFLFFSTFLLRKVGYIFFVFMSGDYYERSIFGKAIQVINHFFKIKYFFFFKDPKVKSLT